MGLHTKVRASNQWVEVSRSPVGGVVVPNAPVLGSPPTQVTSTSMRLAWTQSGDTTQVVGFRLYRNNVEQTSIVLGSAVRATTVTGLTPSTSYTWKIVAYNASGNSADSNSVTQATSASTVTDPSLTYRMGTALGEQTPTADLSGLGGWPAARTYRNGVVTQMIASPYSAKVIAHTDESAWPVAGGQATADEMDDWLLSFYGKTGAPSLHTTIEIQLASGNELDRDNPNLTNIQNTYAAMREVGDKYDNVSIWADFTTFNGVRNGNARPILQRIAPYLDGIGYSTYSPGCDANPPVFTNPNTDTFLSGCLNLSEEFDIVRLGNWEWGATTHATDPNTRPFYIANLNKWWYEQALARGLEPETNLYWDKVGQAYRGPFYFDDNFSTAPQVRSARAHKYWYNYFPAYGGSTPSTWVGKNAGNSGNWG